ncbi:hypothetical protein PMI01_00031 [Caulobacter sp. AP07]|nr:hypothetical protein PMI01_00031 [Caulobacter sp. AP07]
MTVIVKHNEDPFTADLRAMHVATGQPRYGVRLDLLNGGFIRRWSDDRQDALDLYRQALADPAMKAVFCFDHIDIEMLAFDFRPAGRSYEQIKADSEAAIDRILAWTDD